MTQAQLAEEFEVSRSTVRRWLTGASSPGPSIARRFFARASEMGLVSNPPAPSNVPGFVDARRVVIDRAGTHVPGFVEVDGWDDE